MLGGSAGRRPGEAIAVVLAAGVAIALPACAQGIVGPQQGAGGATVKLAQAAGAAGEPIVPPIRRVSPAKAAKDSRAAKAAASKGKSSAAKTAPGAQQPLAKVPTGR